MHRIKMREEQSDLDATNYAYPSNTSPEPTREAPKRVDNDNESMEKASIGNFWVGIPTIRSLNLLPLRILKLRSADFFLWNEPRLDHDGCRNS